MGLCLFFVRWRKYSIYFPVFIGVLLYAQHLFAANTELFYDPTARPKEEVVTESQQQKTQRTDVQMVFKSNNDQFIVVGGDVLKVGGYLGADKLVKIGKNQLELETGKSMKVMHYFPQVLEYKKMDEK